MTSFQVRSKRFLWIVACTGVCLYMDSLENVTISPTANLETITLCIRTLNTFPDGLNKVNYFARKMERKMEKKQKGSKERTYNFRVTLSSVTFTTRASLSSIVG